MNNSFKYLSSVAMWLAMATIWAHMIIPHDHHIVETFLDQEQNCPASHHQTGDKSEFPIHCHAFNDLASEEARSFHLSQNITDGFVALAILPADFLAEPKITSKRIIDFRTSIISSYLHKAYLLRAPPCLA